MNSLSECVQGLSKEQKLWVKYVKKGKIFARYGYFSNYEDGVFCLIAQSKRKNDVIMNSVIKLKDEEILFIGNVETGERIFIDKENVDIKQD